MRMSIGMGLLTPDNGGFLSMSDITTLWVKPTPVQVWTGPKGSRKLWLPDSSRQSAHEGGKVVSPTNRPPLSLPKHTFLVLISVRGWADPSAILRPEGCQWRIPMTPPGIEPATFRPVAQCTRLSVTQHNVTSRFASRLKTVLTILLKIINRITKWHLADVSWKAQYRAECLPD
jgi:hypothetical protein